MTEVEYAAYRDLVGRVNNATLGRSKQAYDAYEKAKHDHVSANAEFFRLYVIGLAELHPELIGFSYENESVYDDEGSYFSCPTVMPTWAEGFELDDPYFLFDDVDTSWDVVSLVCGTPGEWEGETTVERLKEVAF